MTQETALSILKTGTNVFLTGEPGSGKTHTINTYIEWLRSRGIEPAITASTGIAATHVGGMTIHAWSGIGIKTHLTDWDLDEIMTRERVVKRVLPAKVLVIDEISMLDADTLHAVDEAVRAIKKDTRAFGGMQIIFVGDFFQLPPVGKREVRDDIYIDDVPSTPFAFRSVAWSNSEPLVCYLTEQHRHEDAEFARLLSSIRRGEAHEEVREKLLERHTHSDDIPKGIAKLYAHNANVDRENDIHLDALSGAVHTFTMTHRGRDTMVASLMRGCLSPEILRLKEGAQVMFTKNNPTGSFANGTLGVVKTFAPSGNPIVKLRNGREIEVEPMEWNITDGAKILASITQLPLRLAWAITIHKSQGMTLDAAVTDLSKAFEYGQGYVALSRVRTLAGLHVTGLNARALEVHPEALSADEDFIVRSTAGEQLMSEMKKDEYEKHVRTFIEKNGGEYEGVKEIKRPQEKRDTYEVTLEMIHKGMKLPAIAKERNLTLGTIVSHVEKFKKDGTLKTKEIEALISSAVKMHSKKILEAFTKLKTTALTPVHTHLKGKYSFDDIRMVRLLLK